MNVELRQLCIGYQSKKKTRVVADSINATIHQGELTCLLGANGVGKSTLLRTLSAFQPKLGGDILIGSQEIDNYTAATLSQTIGVVLTEKPDVRNMTARELVSLGRSPYTGFWGTCTKEDMDIVNDSLQQVGSSDLAERQIDTLSDGERQKVMIAKALAQQTPVIYLDEPTAFLDFPSKVEVLLLLRRISQASQKVIFLSTHDVELALQVADRIWLMDKSTRKLFIGTALELAQDGILSHFIERNGIHFNSKTLTIQIDKTA